MTQAQLGGRAPAHIANHAQLNEWKMVNILEGEQWAFGRHRDLLESRFVCRLHRRMFGNAISPPCAPPTEKTTALCWLSCALDGG